MSRSEPSFYSRLFAILFKLALVGVVVMVCMQIYRGYEQQTSLESIVKDLIIVAVNDPTYPVQQKIASLVQGVDPTFDASQVKARWPVVGKEINVQFTFHYPVGFFGITYGYPFAVEQAYSKSVYKGAIDTAKDSIEKSQKLTEDRINNGIDEARH